MSGCVHGDDDLVVHDGLTAMSMATMMVMMMAMMMVMTMAMMMVMMMVVSTMMVMIIVMSTNIHTAAAMSRCRDVRTPNKTNTEIQSFVQTS